MAILCHLYLTWKMFKNHIINTKDVYSNTPESMEICLFFIIVRLTGFVFFPEKVFGINSN